MNLRSPLLTLTPLVLPLALGVWAACSGTNEPPTFDIKEPDEDDTAITFETDDSDVEPPTDDTDVPGETDTPPEPTVDCEVPDAPGLATICDLSVNQATAQAPTAAGEPLVMRTLQSGPNPPGAYVSGAAVGNRAIAGFHGYASLRVSELEQIVLDVEHVSGPLTPPAAIAPEIALVVDLTCQYSEYALVNVTFENMGAPTELGDGRQRYTVLATEPKWSVITGLYDESGATLILPDADVARSQDPPLPLGELSDLVGAYPNACLRNTESGDLSMPRDTKTSGVMLTLARATNLVKSEWKVWRVQINDEVHGPP